MLVRFEDINILIYKKLKNIFLNNCIYSNIFQYNYINNHDGYYGYYKFGRYR